MVLSILIRNPYHRKDIEYKDIYKRRIFVYEIYLLANRHYFSLLKLIVQIQLKISSSHHLKRVHTHLLPMLLLSYHLILNFLKENLKISLKFHKLQNDDMIFEKIRRDIYVPSKYFTR